MLEGMKPPVRKAQCAVSQIMARLDEADKKIFQAALDDRENWSHYALATALTERGLQITYASIQRHRRGFCKND